ncbi:hypothetical protein GSI_06436 [Ganoderma sinense ZZ0214-1]|uniref:DRBM domain-containing protein n=1 Tax=Ganoderma sinense ZZ0214-1 TaxID=1077348 RepID=A0A2G8SDA0_9APHY|nr:hypothetical protein GSI_06436 [Ganoderma sinense ZZ0214-1]
MPPEGCAIAATTAATTGSTADSGTCPPPPPSSKPLSPLPILKRSRSPSLPVSTMDSDLPPAPQIDGEAMLEIFVHESIRFTGMPLNSDSPYGDGKRLAIIGNKALDAAFTHLLFDKRPMMTADTLDCEVRKLPDLIEKWVEGYKWREKVRHAKDIDIGTPKETRYLMDAYVGAVFVGGGYRAVLDWIAALVDPSAASPAQQGQHAEPDPKRFRLNQPQQMPPLFPNPAPFPPLQPTYPQAYPQVHHMQHMAPPQPPIPAPPLPPNPLAPAQPQSAFLPLFNQTAQQRRLEVQYPAQFTGPAHAGRWTVQCLVNGMEKGVGTGSSKQLAKEEAARQAYYAMGWAPRV